MALTIRRAVEGDWQVLQELNNFVFQNDKDRDPDMNLNWPFSEQGIKYYQDLTNGNWGRAYIAEEDGRPIGYIALAIKTFDYRKSKYIEVENIGVEPNSQSKGVGTLLMQKADEWAKEIGARGLYVSAYHNNRQAIEFYRKCGFKDWALELEKTY